MSSNEENFFGDTDWINEENTLTLLPPTIQWWRGDLKDKNPLVKNGCWELQTESFEAILGNSVEAVDMVHSGGNVIQAYLFGTLHLSVLAWKKRWYIQDGDRQVFGPYQPGMKSRLQYFCIVKELGNEPAMVSVSGLNAKHLGEANYQFRQKVIQPAMQLARRNFGQHHFWMPVTSQGKIMVPEFNQHITPPGLALKEVNPDVIKSLFLGKEAGLGAESWMGRAKDWAKAQEQARQPVQEEVAPVGNGRPEPPPNWPEGYEPNDEMVSEDEIPF